MFKKIKLKIFSFLLYLFKGLRNADNNVMGTNKESLNGVIGIEEQEEQSNVWKDLLERKLTQRVIDLRYETSHVERESYNYTKFGNTAIKKSGTIEYKGNAENSEDYKIVLVQENKLVEENYGGITKKYRINFIQNFLPKFNLGFYTEKIVLKENDKKYQMDVYFSKYLERYNNKHKFFLSELKKVLMGNKRSEIIDVEKIEFNTSKAFGVNDGVSFVFKVNEFKEIIEYDAYYVIKFNVDKVSEKDYIHEVYNEISERKFKNRERREGYQIDFDEINAINNKKAHEEAEYAKIKDIIINVGD